MWERKNVGAKKCGIEKSGNEKGREDKRPKRSARTEREKMEANLGKDGENGENRLLWVRAATPMRDPKM